MLKNYLKITLRNLLRERLYTVINIVGLSVGSAVVILIYLFVRDEWTFDAFHSNRDRIYRAWVKEHYQGEIFFNTVTPYVLATELAPNIPEIEEVVQYTVFSDLVKQGTFNDRESVHVMMPSFFKVFDFPLLEGDPATAFTELRQVIITPQIARKYFGDTPALGQPLSIMISGQWEQFEVSGIIKPAPANSSLQFDLLIPFENVKAITSERGRSSWQNVTPETYVLLRPGVMPAAIAPKVAALVDDRVAKIYKPGEYQVGFQPLTDIHLNNEFPQGIVRVSDWRYPYILSAVAGLILLLAAINFVTLAVGRSVGRSKEVGVRKVSGATRLQLMQQFWSEAVVLAALAVALGVLLAEVALPAFNSLADKQLDLKLGLSQWVLFSGLVLSLGIGAGVYPALILSGFEPIKAIKGQTTKAGSEKHIVLRSLVGFQFVLSIALIICTLVMQRQLQYLQSKNLGYDRDQIMVLPYSPEPGGNKTLPQINEEGKRQGEVMRQQLNGKPEILGLAVSSHAFGTSGWMQVGYTDPSSRQFRWFTLLGIDYNYLDLMGIGLKAGRNFSESIGADRTGGVIVNETMAKLYGLENSIGQPLPKPFEGFTLVGITRDFNFNSLHTPVEPLAMAIAAQHLAQQCSDMNFNDRPVPKFSIKLAAGKIPAAVNAVKELWQRVAPGKPFDFYFVDEALNRQYDAESRLGRILTVATLLAIFIACLGLFGIATLTTARRTKEIGVRKVMGASTLDIVLLLNGGFTRLVLLASLMAIPLAWYPMRQWLNDFAYRTDIHPLIFILAGVAALAVAWLAVSFQSVHAARRNPVEALRYE